jgi:Icc protein
VIVLQISDTHIKPRGRLAYRRVDTAKALSACVDHVNRFVPRPDVVLIAGDLVDAGDPAEYGLFRELIAPLQIPFFAIPGNHDHRGNMRAGLREHAYLRQDEDFLHYVIDDWPLRIIGIDSTVPGAPGGLLCGERLRWLTKQLAIGSDKPTLMFMHHPPFLTGIRHMDVQNLGNSEMLAELLSPYRETVRLLCGHVHRAVQATWAGIASSIGPSPSHAVALDLGSDSPPSFALEPPACHLITWTAESGFTTHLSFIGDVEGPHPFFNSNGTLID